MRLRQARAWGLGVGTGYTIILDRSLSFQDHADRVVWSSRLMLAMGTAF